MAENLVSKQEHETLSEFQSKVDRAKMENGFREDGDPEHWVETCPQIIKYFNRQGLGKSDYFIYQGVKVTEVGKSDAIKERLAKQIGQINHGNAEAHMNQMTEVKAKAGVAG